MITFSRSGTKVLVYIEINMNTAKEIVATVECGNELYAELLRNKMTDRFSAQIERIRKNEYTRGRKRGKKQEWFRYMMDTTEYGRGE